MEADSDPVGFRGAIPRIAGQRAGDPGPFEGQARDALRPAVDRRRGQTRDASARGVQSSRYSITDEPGSRRSTASLRSTLQAGDRGLSGGYLREVRNLHLQHPGVRQGGRGHPHNAGDHWQELPARGDPGIDLRRGGRGVQRAGASHPPPDQRKCSSSFSSLIGPAASGRRPGAAMPVQLGVQPARDVPDVPLSGELPGHRASLSRSRRRASELHSPL